MGIEASMDPTAVEAQVRADQDARQQANSLLDPFVDLSGLFLCIVHSGRFATADCIHYSTLLDLFSAPSRCFE